MNRSRYLGGFLIAAALVLSAMPLIPSPAQAAPLARIQIGDREELGTSADSNEFASGATNPTYVVGTSTLASVRDWIGHSTCCSGTNYKQSFQLNSLTVGDQYVVSVHPSYLTGNTTYGASITAGTGQIALGSTHTFRQTGYLARPESWQIVIVPSSTSVTIQVGNSATSGNNYMYLDWYVAGSNELRVPAAGLAERVGDLERFDASAYDEFTSAANGPTYVMGSGTLSNVRSWIGHSACGSCGPGTTKTQRLSFTSLTSGQVYYLTAYPAQVTGSSSYAASVASGTATINSGSTYTPAGTGFRSSADLWTIKFTASSSSMTLSLGNGLTSGNHYMYLNWYDFSPEGVSYNSVTPSAFSSAVASYDTLNSGDWWKNDVENSGYLWNEGYVMDSYIKTYRATLDESWLEKLVDHADSALAQRDSVTGVQDCYGESAPAWRESGVPAGSGYVWIGFTGAMFDPMMEFARTVLENPNLAAQTPSWLGGATLGDKARDYVDAFQDAVDHHESEWVPSGSYGWYKFQNDLDTVCGVPGGGPLAGQPAAYDMNALMMGAVLKLADAYRATGNPLASTYEARAAAYARYFRTAWSYDAGTDSHWWNFSLYYTTVDDIGHANFNVKFVADMFNEGLGFSKQDVARVGNTLGNLIQPDSSIPFNEMNGVLNTARNDSAPVWYWNGVTRGNSTLKDEIARRHRFALTKPTSSDGLVSLVHFATTDNLDRY